MCVCVLVCIELANSKGNFAFVLEGMANLVNNASTLIYFTLKNVIRCG